MSTRNWGSMGFWATLYKTKQPSLESPFKSEPLTEKSIYIWSEIGAPKHSGIINGQWNWFPKPEALAGFLRFIELPMYFGIWLVREEWDTEPNRFRRAEELLSLAEISEQCRFKFEIPDMKDLIYQLDTLSDLPDAEIRSGLKDVAKDFNKHWSDTPTWHFKMLIFDTRSMSVKKFLNAQSIQIVGSKCLKRIG